MRKVVNVAADVESARFKVGLRYGLPGAAVLLVISIVTGQAFKGDDSDPRAGQCFSLEYSDASRLTVVSCDQPHDGQIAFVYELPAGPRPTDADLRRDCEERLRRAYGTTTPVAGATPYTALPHEEGDRTVRCGVAAADGQSLTEVLAH